jgi:nucleoid-associated protein YgaU
VESAKPLAVPPVLQGTKEPVHYVVRKGDTLWDISRRLTGDPFLFATIAGDNDIENPDLIFPGQQITLRVADRK